MKERKFGLTDINLNSEYLHSMWIISCKNPQYGRNTMFFFKFTAVIIFINP